MSLYNYNVATPRYTWVKIGSINAQDEVRPHFHVHNRVQNLILIILAKK
jgi:hypothetical protein